MRYALFFCPDDASELSKFGQQALLRCADGQVVSPSFHDFPDASVSERLRATPAFYGFHATLKAPFNLTAEFSEDQLLIEVDGFARQQNSITLSGLYPREIAGFTALTIEPQSVALDELAARCVEHFEPLRKPLSEKDIARRKPDQLSDLQRAYLHRFGYPYVLSEFRFHMTLTGKLEHSADAQYTQWLQALYEENISQAPTLDRVAVFRQLDRDTPFVRIAEFCFDSAI